MPEDDYTIIYLLYGFLNAEVFIGMLSLTNFLKDREIHSKNLPRINRVLCCFPAFGYALLIKFGKDSRVVLYLQLLLFLQGVTLWIVWILQERKIWYVGCLFFVMAASLPLIKGYRPCEEFLQLISLCLLDVLLGLDLIYFHDQTRFSGIKPGVNSSELILHTVFQCLLFYVGYSKEGFAFCALAANGIVECFTMWAFSFYLRVEKKKIQKEEKIVIEEGKRM